MAKVKLSQKIQNNPFALQLFSGNDQAPRLMHKPLPGLGLDSSDHKIRARCNPGTWATQTLCIIKNFSLLASCLTSRPILTTCQLQHRVWRIVYAWGCISRDQDGCPSRLSQWPACLPLYRLSYTISTIQRFPSVGFHEPPIEALQCGSFEQVYS